MSEHDGGSLSRRGFLGAAGGALLASTARPVAAQVPEFPLPEPPGKKLGWAAVGLGRLAVNQILPAIHGCRHSKVTALVSGRPEKARLLAQVHGVDPKKIYSYDSYEQMANDPAIDVV
jgi:hypothetical protein